MNIISVWRSAGLQVFEKVTVHRYYLLDHLCAMQNSKKQKKKESDSLRKKKLQSCY